ncbi:hypothetical protein ABBQ38_000681 [Trebouxia sp. C0009 RCD-2024]
MTVKSSYVSENMQSPLSVLDVLDSPESTVGKQRFSFSRLPPLGGQSINSVFRKSSADGSGSMEGARLSVPAPSRPVLTACSTSPTRPNARGRLKVRSNFLSRSSSLNDNKVLVATQLQRTPSLACPDLFTFGDHFLFEGIIGRSTHSEVYRVRHKRTGELFAIKKSTRRFASKAHRQKCLHEIMAVAALPAHENIVGQYRAWQQNGHFNIQMELCEGGSLAQLLSQLEEAGELLSEEELWYILCEMAQGLRFLHANGVLHLDVKPDNIYRDANGVLKLGDFGLAVLRHQWDWEEGDGKYVAPELLDADVEPTPAADIYSLGATLYECATGETLPRSELANCTQDLALDGRSACLRRTLQCMLQSDEAARPTAEELLAEVQDWDIAAMFSATRPARRKAAAATSEPAAAFQALLETAPSLPSSPFTLQCNEDWQSPSAATPQLRPSKPPRITPPPVCNLQAEAECRPSAPHASADSPPDASMSPDADMASPSGRCESGSVPIPSCSPEVMRCQFKLKRSPHAKALDQANLCISAESQHECLPPAMPSTTPTLLHVSPCRRYARCMQSSEDQSRVRPFPDLSFDTEASEEAVASDMSQVPLITRLDDDVMECSSVDTPPQRQHWSRQSVQEPLIAFAAHAEDVSCNTITRQRVHTPGFPFAYGSPVQSLLQNKLQHVTVTMPTVHTRSPQLRSVDVSTLNNRDIETLDRSCSAMSLS